MSVPRITEILESVTNRYFVIPPSLSNADSGDFPITIATYVERKVYGVNVSNDHASDTVTIVIVDQNGTHTKNILAGKTYSGFYDDIITINVTAGTTYQIELLGL